MNDSWADTALVGVRPAVDESRFVAFEAGPLRIELTLTPGAHGGPAAVAGRIMTRGSADGMLVSVTAPGESPIVDQTTDDGFFLLDGVSAVDGLVFRVRAAGSSEVWRAELPPSDR